MILPFTQTQFYDVFTKYNQAIWPSQFGLYLIAISCIFLIFRKGSLTGAAISAGIGLLWLWMGVVYHILFFSKINPAARYFGFIFILESLLFAWFGIWKGKLKFYKPGYLRSVTGWILILFALIIYPVIGVLTGHHYPAIPTFGLPCPTVIFTVGIMMFLRRPFPRILLVIPVLWSIIGSIAALKLEVYQDFGLTVAGIIGFLALIFYRTSPKSKIAL